MEGLPALNEQALNGFQVTFTQGSVEIVGYNEIYKALSQLSDYLQHIEVTEDNIKENKKLVARISKATKEMNQSRIENKKRFLEPFNVYEGQVKALTELVHGAEETVREQIRELDEMERNQKEDELHELFERRKRPYEYSRFMDFEDFLEPKHLNKSTTVKKVELEMANWLDGMEKDIETLNSLSAQGNFDFPEAMHKYLKCHSVSDTVNYLFEKKKVDEELEEMLVESMKSPTRDQADEYVNVIMKKADLKKIEPVLEAMGIEYSCA